MPQDIIYYNEKYIPGGYEKISELPPYAIQRVVLTIVDDLSDAIFIVDAKTGLIVFSNKMAHEMNGWEYPLLQWKLIDEVNGTSATEAERDAYVEELKSYNGHIMHRHHIHTHKSGKRVYLDVSVTLTELEAVEIRRGYLPPRYRDSREFLEKYFTIDGGSSDILKPKRDPIGIILNEIDKDGFIAVEDRDLLKTLLYRSLKRMVTCGVDRNETEEIKFRKKLEKMAFHDALTGLPNKRSFFQALDRKMKEAGRLKKQNKLAVLFLDIDDFKVLNDTFGHTIGDKILVKFARLLKECVHDTDIVSRFGGDEFNILLTFLSTKSDAQKVIDRIFDSLKEAVEVSNKFFNLRTSIGVKLYDPALDKNLKPKEISDLADQALYTAKKGGKNNACFF